MGGRQVRCKACGATIAIPAEALAVEPVPVQPPPLPVMSAEPPPLPPRRPTAVMSTPPPPFYSQQFQSKPPAFSIGFQYRWWKLLPIVIGLGVLILGAAQWAIAGNSTAVPRTISCKTLETVGSGANHHVQLTDFRAMRNFVRMKKNTVVEYQLIPLVSTQDVIPNPKRRSKVLLDVPDVRPGSIHVLLKTTRVPANNDVGSIVNRPAIDGMTGGMFDTVPTEAANILRSQYPGIDTSKCIILEEGAQPSGGIGIALLSVGLLTLMLGMGLLFLKYE
jgi:hypothetical protein